jgi:phosphinothricin acetyltransferase
MRPLPGRVGDFAIRAAGIADAPAIAGIYNPYVVETAITFEETIVSAAEMATRIAEVTDSKLPFLVADAGGQAIGFAYASKWKGRCAYRHTAETTVYVDRDHWQRGVGTALYGGLLGLLQGAGFHAAIGGIALPNDSSIALHERLGFVKAAHFREVGFKFNRWIDVGYWQLMFAGGFPGPVGQVPSSGQ